MQYPRRSTKNVVNLLSNRARQQCENSALSRSSGNTHRRRIDKRQRGIRQILLGCPGRDVSRFDLTDSRLVFIHQYTGSEFMMRDARELPYDRIHAASTEVAQSLEMAPLYHTVSVQGRSGHRMNG